MPASHSILTILACATLCGLILVEAGYTGQHTTYPHEKTPENVAALQRQLSQLCQFVHAHVRTAGSGAKQRPALSGLSSQLVQHKC